MSEARPAASGVKKWFCATCIEFKHEDAVFERLYYLMCFDCALCVQDPPPQVCHLSHTSPIYCADPFVATVWRWQCISVCSPIFHGVKDTGIGPQTIIIYEFHHPVHPHRLTVFFFLLIDWWDWFLAETWNSFVLTLLCFPRCALL